MLKYDSQKLSKRHFDFEKGELYLKDRSIEWFHTEAKFPGDNLKLVRRRAEAKRSSWLSCNRDRRDRIF